MAIEVFLSGHGGWKPANGYTTVPKGCSIAFYTNFAKNLITGMEYKILEGSWTQTDRVIEEFKSCPNMLLSKQDADWTERSRKMLNLRNDPTAKLLTTPTSIDLSDFFEYWVKKGAGPANFHWMACQTLQLKQSGGRNVGLNAGDFAHDPSQPGRFRLSGAGNVDQWI
jgi:hypothetical protein